MPVEAASQSSIEILLLLRNGITAALPEGILIASLEEVAMQDNADSPQDLPLPHFFASRLITRLKYQQDSKGEVQKWDQKNYLNFLIYTDINLGNMYGNRY